MRIIELGTLQLVEAIRLPRAHLRHRELEMLVHDRAKARFHHHFLRRLLDRLERAYPRIHVGHRNDPIQIVVVVRIGVGRQSELPAPALDKAAPEEIADRNAVGLFVAQGLIHAVQLAQRAVFPPRPAGRATNPIKHAHGYSVL